MLVYSFCLGVLRKHGIRMLSYFELINLLITPLNLFTLGQPLYMCPSWKLACVNVYGIFYTLCVKDLSPGDIGQYTIA